MGPRTGELCLIIIIIIFIHYENTMIMEVCLLALIKPNCKFVIAIMH